MVSITFLQQSIAKIENVTILNVVANLNVFAHLTKSITFCYLLAYIYTKQSSTYFLSRFRGRKIISDCEALHTIFQGKVFRDEDQIFTNLVLSWLQLSPLSTLTLPLFTLATRELFTPPYWGWYTPY